MLNFFEMKGLELSEYAVAAAPGDSSSGCVHNSGNVISTKINTAATISG
jgi:hypothetical protein